MGHHTCDLEHPDQFAAALDAADVTLGNFDTVIVSAAQDVLERDVDFSM